MEPGLGQRAHHRLEGAPTAQGSLSFYLKEVDCQSQILMIEATMIRQINPHPGVEPQVIIEEVTDPVEIERHRLHMEAFRLNSDWLEGHWGTVMPQARGKFVAVAGQEAFLAESADEAWAWAARVHPEDISPLVQFVHQRLGPR